MLAKVFYPGPGGEAKIVRRRMPEPPPRTYVFKNPVDGTDVRATLEKVEDSMQPGGGLAFYGAQPDSP
jgi:hypothetical protein